MSGYSDQLSTFLKLQPSTSDGNAIVIDQVYLTGYRGTGKTSVARRLADALGGEFLDLDDVIESRAGRSIREIFEAGGEESFRDWETRCLAEVAGKSMLPSNPKRILRTNEMTRVLALGGGAILREKNRQIIRDGGVCIWLDASAKTLAARLSGDQSTASRRPALTDLSPEDEIEELLRQRRPLYLEVSDTRIDTDHRSPEQVAQVALEWIRSR